MWRAGSRMKSKNPLTPIQLSAERLKRQYGRLIVQERDVFDQCTDTIIRQVDDIKRMVDEFSSFARMPKARPNATISSIACARSCSSCGSHVPIF